MPTIFVEGLIDRASNGPVHIQQTGENLRITGDFQPPIAEIIGHTHVEVQSVTPGDCIEDNPVTHKGNAIEHKVYEASDVIVEAVSPAEKSQ